MDIVPGAAGAEIEDGWLEIGDRAGLEAAVSDLLAKAARPDPAGFLWLDPEIWARLTAAAEDGDRS